MVSLPQTHRVGTTHADRSRMPEGLPLYVSLKYERPFPSQAKRSIALVRRQLIVRSIIDSF